MEELYTIAGSALLYFSGILFHRTMGLFYRIIVAQLGKEEYGLLSLGMAVFGIFNIIAVSGIKVGLIHFVSYYRGKNDLEKIKGTISSAIKTSIIFSLLSGCLLYSFSGFIAQKLFHNKDLVYILKIFALSSPLWAMTTVLLSVPLAMEKIKYLVYTQQFFESLANFFLALILILLGFGLKGVAHSFLITQVFCLILSIYFLKKVPSFRINILSAKVDWEILRYSLPLTYSSLIWALFIRSDTLMLGSLKSAAAAGIYNAAVPFSWILFVIPLSTNSVFQPIVTRLYAQGKDIKNICRSVSRWILVGNLPLTIILVFFSREIIAIFFGEKYILAQGALRILSVGYFIYSINIPKANLLLMLKKTSFVFILNASALIVNILLNLYLIPIYGIKGAALATSLSLALFIILLELFIYKFTKIHTFDVDCLNSIIAAGLSLGLIYIINSFLLASGYNEPCRAIIGSVLFLGFYAGGLVVFRGVKEEDKTLFKNYWNKATAIFFLREEAV